MNHGRLDCAPLLQYTTLGAAFASLVVAVRAATMPAVDRTTTATPAATRVEAVQCEK